MTIHSCQSMPSTIQCTADRGTTTTNNPTLFVVLHVFVNHSFFAKCCNCLGLNDALCLKSLERRDLNELCESVKLFIGIFVFITLSRKSDTDSGGWLFDTSAPDELVKSGIDSDILGSHGLFSKLANFLDCPWRTALELLLVNAFG